MLVVVSVDVDVDVAGVIVVAIGSFSCQLSCRLAVACLSLGWQLKLFTFFDATI